MNDAALDRWLAAVNGRGKLALTEAAVSSEVRVERLGFGDRRGEVVEVFEGAAAVNDWLARTREVVHFEIVARTEAEARYVVCVDGESWRGGGLWRWRMADDGRLSWLHHQPDDLSASDGATAQEHQHGHGDDDHRHA